MARKRNIQSESVRELRLGQPREGQHEHASEKAAGSHMITQASMVRLCSSASLNSSFALGLDFFTQQARPRHKRAQLGASDIQGNVLEATL